ncbi:MAG TPA: 3-dehydroquinate synthase [Flavobacterium sp.]|jgi:3-dehydroquinate synthase
MHPITSIGHNIYFGESGYDALNEIVYIKRYSSAFILCDTNTAEYCLPIFLPMFATEITIEIIEIDAGESMKTIETCVEVWKTLTELGADRKSLIINVGGGVISDLGGFIASTYKRGIDFINVPTTLLGMVDASIGGKNGVDLGHLKNQIGTITAPKLVVVDTDYLTTLPPNEMRSGLAEMLKHGLIADAGYWKKFRNINELDQSAFDHLVFESVVIKNDIVIQDPTEEGLRKALNFGHTIGHAIESYFLASDDKQNLLHGEAVAAGMVLESSLAVQKKLLSYDEFDEIHNLIKKTFGQIIFTGIDVTAILELLIHDKKNEYGEVRFALIDKIGRIVIDQTATQEQIFEAFRIYSL